MSLAALRLRAFRRLLFCYGVNQLGDWAGEIALAVAVFAATGSAAAVAITWIVHRCGFGLLAPVLVARLERLRRQRVLVAVYLLEAVVFVVLAASATSVGLLAILPLVAVDGLLAPVARALARTALVEVTRPAGLHREGNALLNVVFTANGVLAPAIGGLGVAAVGPAAVLLINAASFAVVAGALATCTLPSDTAAPRVAATGGRLRDALSYVGQRPVLRGLLSGEAALGVFLAAILPIEVVFITDTLGATEAAFGAVLTAWGLGMILGGVAAARLAHAPLPAMLLSAGSAQALACLGMGASGTVATVVVWSTIGGIGNGIYGMAIVTAIQERTSDAYQARINGLYEALMSVGPGLGFAIGGIVATCASPRAVYVVAGVGSLTVLAWATVKLRGADWAPALPPREPGPEQLAAA